MAKTSKKRGHLGSYIFLFFCILKGISPYEVDLSDVAD